MNSAVSCGMTCVTCLPNKAKLQWWKAKYECICNWKLRGQGWALFLFLHFHVGCTSVQSTGINVGPSSVQTTCNLWGLSYANVICKMASAVKKVSAWNISIRASQTAVMDLITPGTKFAKKLKSTMNSSAMRPSLSMQHGQLPSLPCYCCQGCIIVTPKMVCLKHYLLTRSRGN